MPATSVPLRYAYRLLNHGPTTLITSRAGMRHNVMAAQWVMPVDFDPPKLALVLDRQTFTHELVSASNVVGVSIPMREQAALVARVGTISGREADKLAAIETFPGSTLDVPLVAGCLGWLEARVAHSPALDEVATAYELVVLEVVAAAADPRCWQNNHLVLDEVATLHHLGGGVFRASGELVTGR